MEVRVDDPGCTSAGGLDVAGSRGGGACNVGCLFDDRMIVERRGIERPDSGVKPSISNSVDAIGGHPAHRLLLVVGQGPESLGRHLVEVGEDVG